MATVVQHKVTKQRGDLIRKGVWYSAVRFDGDYHPSVVSNTSLRRIG